MSNKAVRVGRWGEERVLGVTRCAICRQTPLQGQFVVVVDCYRSGELVGCSVLHPDCLEEMTNGLPTFAADAAERLLDIGQHLAEDEEASQGSTRSLSTSTS